MAVADDRREGGGKRKLGLLAEHRTGRSQQLAEGVAALGKDVRQQRAQWAIGHGRRFQHDAQPSGQDGRLRRGELDGVL